MSFEKDWGLNPLPATTDVSTARSLKSRSWTVHVRARSRLRTVQSEERFLIIIPRSVCLQSPAAHVDYPLKRRFVVRRRRLLWINSFQDLRNGCSYMIAGKSARIRCVGIASALSDNVVQAGSTPSIVCSVPMQAVAVKILLAVNGSVTCFAASIMGNTRAQE